MMSLGQVSEEDLLCDFLDEDEDEIGLMTYSVSKKFGLLKPKLLTELERDLALEVDDDLDIGCCDRFGV